MNRIFLVTAALLALPAFTVLTFFQQENSREMFLDELNQMWGAVEFCEVTEDCYLVGPRWRETLKISFGLRLEPHAKQKEVQEIAEAFLPAIASYIGPDVVFDEADPNVFFAFVDDELIQILVDGSLPKIASKNKAKELIEPVFRSGNCLATLGTRRNGGIDEIVGVVIWVNTHLKGEELSRCLVEEFVNSTGLTGDGHGHASLLENGNYRLKNGVIFPSERTECMLRAIYTADETASKVSEEFFDRKDVPEYCKL